MRALVFIPALNEEDSIRETIETILQKSNFDILIVDDGSNDDTLEITARYPSSRITTITKDKRYHLRDSFKIAFDYFNTHYYNKTYKYLICFDCGNSFKFEEILPHLNADLVIGCRDYKELKKQNPKRAKVSRLGTFMFNVLHFTKFKDTTSGFRAYHRDLVYRTEWNKLRGRRFSIQQDLLSYFRKADYKEFIASYEYTNSSFNLTVVLDSLKNIFKKVFYKPKVAPPER